VSGMTLATGSGSAAIPAASALPLTCHLTVIARTMRNELRESIREVDFDDHDCLVP